MKHLCLLIYLWLLTSCMYETFVVDYTEEVFKHGPLKKGTIYELKTDLFTDGNEIFDTMQLRDQYGIRTSVITIQDYVDNPSILPGYFILPKGTLLELISAKYYRQINSYIEYEVKIGSGSFRGRVLLDKNRTIFYHRLHKEYFYSFRSDKVKPVAKKTGN